MLKNHLSRMNYAIAGYGTMLGSLAYLGALDLGTATVASAAGATALAGGYYHWAARKF